MAYQHLNRHTGEWVTAPASVELEAMLERHPLGVSFIVEGMGVVKWRKAPRDAELIGCIQNVIESGAPTRFQSGVLAESVYDMLEERGLV